jgi:hypothetical protein
MDVDVQCAASPCTGVVPPAHAPLILGGRVGLTRCVVAADDAMRRSDEAA